MFGNEQAFVYVNHIPAKKLLKVSAAKGFTLPGRVYGEVWCILSLSRSWTCRTPRRHRYKKSPPPRLPDCFGLSKQGLRKSFIITLEGGSFIVVDGGTSNSTVGTGNCRRLYNKLTELNKRPDGKIVIAAWVITHAHMDHYTTFQQFAMDYGKNVTLEMVIINTPPAIIASNTRNYDPFNGTGEDIAKTVKLYNNKVKVYKPHTGHVFYIRHVKVEVLFTFEDFFSV